MDIQVYKSVRLYLLWIVVRSSVSALRSPFSALRSPFSALRSSIPLPWAIIAVACAVGVVVIGPIVALLFRTACFLVNS